MGEREYLEKIEKACTMIIGDGNSSVETCEEFAKVLSETQERLKRLDDADRFELMCRCQKR